MTHEQIIEAVEKMTVLELKDLVKAIEEKWGVSAAAVAVAAGPAAGAAEFHAARAGPAAAGRAHSAGRRYGGLPGGRHFVGGRPACAR